MGLIEAGEDLFNARIEPRMHKKGLGLYLPACSALRTRA
jgi:hypothetical protein